MITERAMLAAIHISIWTAVKHDRKVSHEVASQHGAPVSAGRYKSNCCAALAGSTSYGRSPVRSVRTSTRSRCPGRTKVTACCQLTSTSI